MSEEFTERYSRRRYPPSRRRARSRSFSSDRSYSTRSKSLTPHSSSPASRSSRFDRVITVKYSFLITSFLDRADLSVDHLNEVTDNRHQNLIEARVVETAREVAHQPISVVVATNVASNHIAHRNVATGMLYHP